MEKNSWLHKVINEEVLKTVKQDRQILNFICERRHCSIGHVLIRYEFLHEITESEVNQQEGENNANAT